MFLSLAVAVGGHREFPNGAISGNALRKPWRNGASKALLHFFEAEDDWSKSWKNGETDLIVDYVKVFAV